MEPGPAATLTPFEHVRCAHGSICCRFRDERDEAFFDRIGVSATALRGVSGRKESS
jgi:hypothetical protein